MTKDKINQKYLDLHNALGKQKDAPDRNLFDQHHRQIWANCEKELETRKVELEAKASLSTDEIQEIGELKCMFPKRTLAKSLTQIEIDEIKASIEVIKTFLGIG